MMIGEGLIQKVEVGHLFFLLVVQFALRQSTLFRTYVISRYYVTVLQGI